MALPLTSMTLADGNDPIDAVYAEASMSASLNTGSAAERRSAADARVAARFSLDGKAAINRHQQRLTENTTVSGGYGALGFSCGLAMLEHGVLYLGIIDRVRDETKLDILRLRGGRQTIILEFIVDLSSDSAAEQALDYFCTSFPRLDLVLCCTGIVGVEHALETTAAKWKTMLDINTTSGFLVAQAAAKHMIRYSKKQNKDGQDLVRCNGSITLISSISAHHVNFPQPQAAYNVSKAAVSHMARSLAAEWAVYGIRVNSISPGYLDTPLNVGEHLDEAKKVWYARTPLGRMGRTDEIAGVVVLLGSPAGSYITGADFVVDGECERRLGIDLRAHVTESSADGWTIRM